MSKALKEKLYDGPVYIDATFIFIKPKSTPKKVKYPAVKPDLKNLVWGLEDAMEGIVYKNDSQVVEHVTRKLYGDPPGIRVKVGKI